jgi:hypothetical protein
VHSDTTSNLSAFTKCYESEVSSQEDFDKTEKYKSFNAAGWLNVLAGVCTHLVVGNEYLWGNVNGYVISYFHNMGDSVKNNQACIILPL